MRKVLIADDSSDLRLLVKAIVEDSGLNVIEAVDGPSCLRLIHTDDPELILLDYMMPGLDGLQVLQQLRQWRSEIPVIMLTVNEDRDTIIACFQAGASDYLVKPFNGEDLLKAIHKALFLKEIQTEQAHRSADHFTGVFSHELNTALQGVQSYWEFAREDLSDGDVERATTTLEEMGHSLERLRALINTSIDSTRIGEHGVSLKPVQLDLKAEVEEAISGLYSSAEEKVIALQLEGRSGVVLRADKVRLWQLVSNLMTNAIKFTPKGGTIRIHVEGDEQNALFSVSDTGVGIPEDELIMIFGKFNQSSRTGGKFAGTGLGLAICRAIVRAHGGRLWAENNATEGATFFVQLPLA